MIKNQSKPLILGKAKRQTFRIKIQSRKKSDQAFLIKKRQKNHSNSKIQQLTSHYRKRCETLLSKLSQLVPDKAYVLPAPIQRKHLNTRKQLQKLINDSKLRILSKQQLKSKNIINSNQKSQIFSIKVNTRKNAQVKKAFIRIFLSSGIKSTSNRSVKR